MLRMVVVPGAAGGTVICKVLRIIGRGLMFWNVHCTCYIMSCCM